MLNKLFFIVLLLFSVAIILLMILLPFGLNLNWNMPGVQKYYWGVHIIDIDVMKEDFFWTFLFWFILTSIIASFVIYQSWKEIFKKKHRYY